MNERIRPVLILLAFVAFLPVPQSAIARAKPAHAKMVAPVALQGVLDKAMAGTSTPAMGVLVIRDGRVAAQAIRGVRRNDRPDKARLGDAWLIGSTAKPMTVALIARLVDRGVLSWDKPLAAMLPDLAGAMRAEYRTITLTQLLSHRSGLPENLGDSRALDGFFTDARPLPDQRLALIKLALQEKPVAAPGAEFSYSNTGFLIAAVIAERATGHQFEELMRDEVFAPLGMRSAVFGPTSGSGLVGHRAGKPVTKAMSKSDDGVPMAYTAAGNVHMSLQDWARFCLDQLAGSRGRGALLKPASYRLMQTAQPGSGAGLDWGVQDSIAGRKGPVLVHGGSDGNWLAWVVLFPERSAGILVIANAADDMGADKATHAVVGALLPP